MHYRVRVTLLACMLPWDSLLDAHSSSCGPLIVARLPGGIPISGILRPWQSSRLLQLSLSESSMHLNS